MSCFANKSVKLILDERYIGVVQNLIRPESSSAEWLLKPVNESNPCMGFYLQQVGGTGLMNYSDDPNTHALSLTNDENQAAQAYPRPDWDKRTFTIVLTGAITAAGDKTLTLDKTYNGSGTAFRPAYPRNKDPIYQHCPIDRSGLTFSFTVDESTVRAALSLYGLSLDKASISELISNMPHWTYDYLQTVDTTRPRRSIFGAIVGTILGTIIGGVVGFLVGGPYGAGAGAIAGGAAGLQIGASIQPRDDTKVDSVVHQLAEGNAEAMRSYIDISPAGGPYANNHAWEDIQKLTHFPMIGDAGLPLGGCVIPPTSGSRKLRTWLPASNTIVVYPTDDQLYPPLNNVFGGRKIYLQLFVVVKVQLSSGYKYQMRIHPKWVNTPGDPNRKVHSQLSDGSRLWALVQGAGTQNMAVYAAGELYLVADDGGDRAGTLLGMAPQTGHYFNHTSTFDSEVYTTLKRALQALGYDVSNLKRGKDLTDEIYGYNLYM